MSELDKASRYCTFFNMPSPPFIACSVTGTMRCPVELAYQQYASSVCWLFSMARL